MTSRQEITEWSTVKKCNFCLQNRRNDWSIRMWWENRISMNSSFMTLTYDPKKVPRTKDKKLTLRKKHLYRFLKSLKQHQRRYLKTMYWKGYELNWNIRYFAVGEYGSKGTIRPHYHLILFNIHPDVVEDVRLGKVWGKGFVHAGNVTIESASYCAKYVIDKEPMMDKDKRQKPFATMSRNPGIGKYYLEKNRDWHRSEGTYHPDEMRMYMMHEGQKRRLPRYYRDKIFKPLPGEREEILKMGLEIKYAEIAQEILEHEKQELERLSKLHKFPKEYLEEQRKFHHDNIRIKSLQLNSL